MSQIDPRLRLMARALSIRHVDNPVVRAATRTVLRHLPSVNATGISVKIVHYRSISMRVFIPKDNESHTEPRRNLNASTHDGTRPRQHHGTEPHPGLLWIHGGGLVVGSARQDDGLCARTAASLGTVVVSVDYRLAPEHPYPAAINDVYLAWQWMIAHGSQLHIDVNRLAIGGESAGGGLAACLTQRVHDQEGIQPIAQWLFAPMLDDRTATDRSLDAINHFVWNNQANRYAWNAYLPVAAGSQAVPKYASASRRDDVSGLPPTWLYATDIELFHDEVCLYAQRLHDAGVDVTLEHVPAAAHAFELFENTEPARQLLTRSRRWLNAQFELSLSDGDNNCSTTTSRSNAQQ